MSATRKVPFFDYPRLFNDDREGLLNIVEEVGKRGAYIMQSDLVDFESQLAKYTGAQFAIGVGNATDALEFGWMSIGLKPGDEVILCSHTMLATASAVVTAGGTPIPVEIGEDCLIDPQAVEAAKDAAGAAKDAVSAAGTAAKDAAVAVGGAAAEAAKGAAGEVSKDVKEVGAAAAAAASSAAGSASDAAAKAVEAAKEAAAKEAKK